MTIGGLTESEATDIINNGMPDPGQPDAYMSSVGPGDMVRVGSVPGAEPSDMRWVRKDSPDPLMDSYGIPGNVINQGSDSVQAYLRDERERESREETPRSILKRNRHSSPDPTMSYSGFTGFPGTMRGNRKKV